MSFKYELLKKLVVAAGLKKRWLSATTEELLENRRKQNAKNRIPALKDDAFEFSLRLFGIIPFGTHTIRIVRFDPEKISSREGNRHVPVWNHDIQLVAINENHTEYTDRVEIRAGWKTLFIWLWAKAFYTHRQRKWIRLLKEGEAQ